MLRFLSAFVAAALLLACGPNPASVARAPIPAASPTSNANTSATPSASEPLPELGARLPLLGGRLTMAGLIGSTIEARSHDLMSADAPDEEETRIVLVPGEEQARFVALASDEFAYGTGNIAEDARTLFGSDATSLDVRPLTLAAGLSGVRYELEQQRASQHALFLLGAIVERAEHSLCDLKFFILPEMAGERGRWANLAQQLLASLEPGSAGTPSAREHLLDADGTRLALQLNEPSRLTVQHGPDFSVYHLRSLVKVGAPRTGIGVYVGEYPDYQHKQAETAAEVTETPGTLLGKSVRWHTWQPSPELFMSEAIVALDADQKIHVFVTGTKDDLARLRKAAESMRKVPSTPRK